jgi:hypothetical protein
LLGIEGLVEGPDQHPAEDVLVSAWAKQKPGEVPVTRRTDAHGRFNLTDLEPGVWRVMASRSGAAPAFADAPAGTTGLRLRLSAGGRLSGRVTDGRGTPITLFTILVESEAPQTASFIDPKGRYEIGGLAPGPAVVSAVAPDHAPSNEMRVTIPQSDPPATAAGSGPTAGARSPAQSPEEVAPGPVFITNLRGFACPRAWLRDCLEGAWFDCRPRSQARRQSRRQAPPRGGTHR